MRNFAMLGMSPFYAPMLAAIYRCGACSHLFAPRPDRQRDSRSA